MGEPRQDQKEMDRHPPLPGSQVLASASQAGQAYLGLAELRAGSLVTPRLIPEIDLKGASQFVLIERHIFVCSSMDFLGEVGKQT